jgi:hypothetical protein
MSAIAAIAKIEEKRIQTPNESGPRECKRNGVAATWASGLATEATLLQEALRQLCFENTTVGMGGYLRERAMQLVSTLLVAIARKPTDE